MIALMMLTALLVYVLVAFLVIRAAVRIPKKRTTRWAVGLVVLVVFALIPTWDIVPGRLFFAHLCETEGGLTVYKVVEFPTEWDGRGRAPFMTERGFFDPTYFGNRYRWGHTSEIAWPAYFRIKKETDYVVDAANGERLGQYVYLIYKGGWLINSTGLHVSGTLCRVYPKGYFPDFLRHIFVPAVSDKKREGGAR